MFVSFAVQAFLVNEDLGDSLDSVEALSKKHDDFEKSLAAQEEKIKVIILSDLLCCACVELYHLSCCVCVGLFQLSCCVCVCWTISFVMFDSLTE